VVNEKAERPVNTKGVDSFLAEQRASPPGAPSNTRLPQ
jgi:hypothetical protein